MKIIPESTLYIPIVLVRLFETYARHMSKADRLAAAACVLGLDPAADIEDIVGEILELED